MNWAWHCEGPRDWHLEQTGDPVDGTRVFATYTGARRALLRSLRGTKDDWQAAASEVSRLRRRDWLR